MMFPALSQLGWITALANHLWQSTVFVLAAWLLAFALRNNQARTRYWLWIVTSIKFLLPFSLLIAVGEWLHPKVSAVGATPAFLTVMSDVTQPLAFYTGTLRGAAAAPAVSFLGNTPVAGRHPDMLPMILVAVWFIGAFALLARWALRWWSLRRVVRAATPLHLDGCPVPVLSTSQHLEPGIFGIFRPVLLLPEGICERLSPEQFDAVIAHELSHVRRRDNLTAAVHMLVEAAFWFYPLVWWIGSRLLEERERACDEAVLESRGEPLAYAEGILCVCKSYMEAPLSCVSGVTGSDLKKRITRVMASPAIQKLDVSRKLLMALTAVCLLTVPVTVGVMHAAAQQSQVAAKETGIQGTWQGTFHVQGQQFRAVVKVSGTDLSNLHVDLYSIDQSGQPIPATSASFQDGVFKYAIKLMDSSFEGKMSADGQSISGTVTQGPISTAIVLVRATPETAWTIPAPPPKIPPMAANANPSFEVATIKPSPPGRPGKGFTLRGSDIIGINLTLLDMITLAYDVQQSQVVGGPKWMSSDKYDLDGKPDTPGLPSLGQAKTMLKKLLADRFQFKFHRETKKMAAYVLAVAKNGPKMDKGDPNALPGLGFIQLGDMVVRNATMDEFAQVMQTSVLDRPVVNDTGLQGTWNFLLKWRPDEPQFGGMGMKVPPPSNAANAPPPIFTAIQEQIGLKLEARKASVPVLVLDHVEPPSPN